MKKIICFAHELGTIMYVGGILSHIVIGAIFSGGTAQTIATVYTYKLESAYILILPGLAIKIVSDLISFFVFGERAWWMRIKLLATAFLTVNAFVFLVPMMPELLQLATDSIPDVHLNEDFHILESKEAIIGMSNIIPLALEMTMGAFRPKLTRRERVNAR